MIVVLPIENRRKLVVDNLWSVNRESLVPMPDVLPNSESALQLSFCAN